LVQSQASKHNLSTLLLAMRFCSAVLLATLGIAPVCAEHIEVSNKLRVNNSTLLVDGADADCSDGGLRFSGNDNNHGGSSRGRDIIRRGPAGRVVESWWRRRVEKKYNVATRGGRGVTATTSTMSI
jgi:hypothetical protein